MLARSDFDLVAEELLDAAVVYGNWLGSNGFTVDVEPWDLEYPNTPVFRGNRNGGTYFCEVASAVDLGRAEEWAKYGKACSSEVRFVAVVANGNDIPQRTLMRLRSIGVGLDVVDDAAVYSLLGAHDLSLAVNFPALSGELLVLFASARDLLEQGHWKEAFEDACLVLEAEARDYLAKAARSQRAFVGDDGKPVHYTETQIQRKTLGQLAIGYRELAQPSQAESRIAQSLSRINPHRVTVAHFKHKSGQRADELRAKVGKEIMVIVNTMKMLRPQ